VLDDDANATLRLLTMTSRQLDPIENSNWFVSPDINQLVLKDSVQ
jgi:hypothetical protein